MKQALQRATEFKKTCNHNTASHIAVVPFKPSASHIAVVPFKSSASHIAVVPFKPSTSHGAGPSSHRRIIDG